MPRRERVLLVVLPSTFPNDHLPELLSDVLADVVSLDAGKSSRSVTAGFLDSETHPAAVAALLEVIRAERRLSLELVGDSFKVSGSVQ